VPEIGSTQGILAERSPARARGSWVPERVAEWVNTLMKRSKNPASVSPLVSWPVSERGLNEVEAVEKTDLATVGMLGVSLVVHHVNMSYTSVHILPHLLQLR